MKKEQAQEYIEQKLEENDTLIGFFQATKLPSMWWFLLIGVLLFLGLRVYFIGITERGLYFHKLSLFGKFESYDFFNFEEIESVKIGKGLIQRPMKFHFKNERKMKVKAQLKGVERLAKLTPDLQSYIEDKIQLAN